MENDRENYVVGLFEVHQHAQAGVDELLAAGVSKDDISVVMNARATGTEQFTRSDQESVNGNSFTGVAVGGATGLLLGLVALVTPAASGLVGAGPLVLALTGAGVGAIGGGIVGAMNQLGVPTERASLYDEALQRGGVLVSVHADDPEAERYAEILRKSGALSVDAHAGPNRKGGWQELPSAATENAPKPQNVPQAAYLDKERS